MKKRIAYTTVIIVLIMMCSLMVNGQQNNVLVLAFAADQAAWASANATLVMRIDEYVLMELPPGLLARYEVSRLHYNLIDEYHEDYIYYVVSSRVPGVSMSMPALDNGRILFTGDDFAIIEAPPTVAEALATRGYTIQRVFLEALPWDPLQLSRGDYSVTYSSRIAETIARIFPEDLYDATAALSGMVPVTIAGEAYTIQTRNSYQLEAIQQATRYAYEYFEDLGYPVSYFTFDGPGQRNVIATKEGVLYPDMYYLISGHIDDLPEGDIAPGANDNASGSVGVMVAADLLATWQTDYSVIFALWTGEEQGLHGSRAFAREAYNTGMQLLGVINMDMIAWSSQDIPIVQIEAWQQVVPESCVLAQTIAQVSTLYDLDLVVKIDPSGGRSSDHLSFWYYGYTAVTLIQDLDDFFPFYHSVDDLVTVLNIPYFTNICKAMVATVLHLTTSTPVVTEGDIDISGRVDGLDLILLSRAFGTSTGDTDFQAAADFDQSGTIDSNDLAILTARFGYSVF